MEPSFSYCPAHQPLGAALLEQGKFEEAQAAFRRALQHASNNGWAASGLLRAAEARSDQDTGDQARGVIEKNWFGEQQPSLDHL